MIVYRTIADLKSHLDVIQKAGKSIGLVPTMGALHQGHASLIESANGDNDIVVVTIFVNPTQFGDPADLQNYPRKTDEDLEFLQSLNVDIVFVPSVTEMYPLEDQRTFDLAPLDTVMEGKYREGHFNGVAQIVSKLFEAVMPDRSYFGQKDFQQLVIVKRVVKLLNLDLDIISCPIVRENDGLAMSSRNALLTRSERNIASFIFITLNIAREKRSSLTPSELKSWVETQFKTEPDMKLEYFDIVEDEELRPITDWGEKVNKVGCIAVQLGRVRLIDNMNFN